jgi:hypothetical protein
MLVPDLKRPTDAINMCQILLKDVSNYVKAMQNMWSEMQTSKGWKLPRQSLLDCTIVTMGILNHLRLENADLRDMKSPNPNAQFVTQLPFGNAAIELCRTVIFTSTRWRHMALFLKEPLPSVMLLGS